MLLVTSKRESRTSFSSPASFLAVLVIVTLGCRSIPEERLPKEVSEGGPTPELFERKPIDIAVLPPFTGRRHEPKLASALRAEVKSELIGKRYSPIAFDAIDSKLGEFPDSRELDVNDMRGNFDEDAILYIRLKQWDDDLLKEFQLMTLGVTFTLYDSRTGRVLWEHRIADRTTGLPSAGRDGDETTVFRTLASRTVSDAPASLPGKDDVQRAGAGE